MNDRFTERRTKRERSSKRSLVHSASEYNGQSLADPKPGFRSHLPHGCRDPKTCHLALPGSQEGAGEELKQPGLEQAPIWDAGTCRWGINPPQHQPPDFVGPQHQLPDFEVLHIQLLHYLPTSKKPTKQKKKLTAGTTEAQCVLLHCLIHAPLPSQSCPRVSKLTVREKGRLT